MVVEKEAPIIAPEFQLNKAKEPVALFVFAHGAGADMDSTFMSDFSERLTGEGISVLRFNFIYMTRRKSDDKKYPPDRMPKLIACYEQILAQNVVVNSGLPVVIGGKSMGSRVAATILNDSNALACFCLGYPFHPQKKPEKLRLAPLQSTKKPVMILQGERDTLGSQAEIAGYDLPDYCLFEYFVDGDHDLKPRVRSGLTHEQHLARAAQVIVEKIKGLLNE